MKRKISPVFSLVTAIDEHQSEVSPSLIMSFCTFVSSFCDAALLMENDRRYSLLYRRCVMLNWNSRNKCFAQIFLSTLRIYKFINKTPVLCSGTTGACDVLIFGAEVI